VPVFGQPAPERFEMLRQVGIGTWQSEPIARRGPNMVLEAFPSGSSSSPAATLTLLDAPSGGQLMPVVDPYCASISLTGYAKWPARGVLDQVAVKLVVVTGIWTVWGAFTESVVDLVAPTYQGALADHSGTITAGGASQQAAPANPTRRYLLFENVSAADLWMDFGTPAVQSQPSYRLFSGGSLVMEAGFVSTQSVHVIGASTGQAFTLKDAS
jgi:hypothetical protein